MPWLLLLRYWRAALFSVLALTIVLQVRAHNRALVDRGQALERARIADSTLAALTPRLAHVDTLIVRDTLTVRRTIARVDTLRETVLAHLTDTVVVKEFIERTDSALKACSVLAGDCAAFRAMATEKFAAYEAKLAAQPAIVVKSCATRALVVGVLGAAGGFAVGWKIR